MNEEKKPKGRRIKVPDGLDLLHHKKLKSHWDWYWKHHSKDKPKRIIVDFDNLPPE